MYSKPKYRSMISPKSRIRGGAGPGVPPPVPPPVAAPTADETQANTAAQDAITKHRETDTIKDEIKQNAINVYNYAYIAYTSFTSAAAQTARDQIELIKNNVEQLLTNIQTKYTEVKQQLDTITALSSTSTIADALLRIQNNLDKIKNNQNITTRYKNYIDETYEYAAELLNHISGGGVAPHNPPNSIWNIILELNADNAVLDANKAKHKAREINRIVKKVYNAMVDAYNASNATIANNEADKAETLANNADGLSVMVNTYLQTILGYQSEINNINTIPTYVKDINITQNALNIATQAVADATKYNTDVQGYIDKIQLYKNQAREYAVNLGGDNGILPDHPNMLADYKKYIEEICDILNITGTTRIGLINRLLTFSDSDKYKFIKDVITHLNELKKADEGIQEFMEDNSEVDLTELNDNLAELQILSILQRNESDIIKKLVDLIKDKTKQVNENLRKGLTGGSSKDIYISKYLKYKNKYLLLKKNSI